MTGSESLNCRMCGKTMTIIAGQDRVACPTCGHLMILQSDWFGSAPPPLPTETLAPPVKLETGKTGLIKAHRFTVLGRVRIEHDDGYWDEWYLEFDNGAFAWLAEEAGEYSLMHPQPLTSPAPPFDQVWVGSSLTVNGQPFFVSERCRGQVAKVEGDVGYNPQPGEPVLVIDGNVRGRLASLQYGPDEIEFFTGEEIAPGEIRLDGN